MSLAIPHVHLPHPSWPQVRHTLETGAVVASWSGWTCAAVTVVGLGYGRHLVAAAALGVAYLAGAYRTKRVWSARHRHVLEQVQRGYSAQQREMARQLAALSAYAAADREPYAARKDRHINRRPRAGVSNGRSGA